MAEVSLKQLVGNRRDPRTGRIFRIGWNMDFLMLGGKAIATINRVPGAAVGLYPGVMLTPSERTAVEEAVAAARNGVKPVSIGGPIEVNYEVLDDEEGDELSDTEEETEVEDD